MKRISISRAWDRTREQLARDGRLYFAVSGAFVALPTAGRWTLAPPDPTTPPGSLESLFGLLLLFLAMIALVTTSVLASGRAQRVGEAIGRGARRMPAALLAGMLWGLPTLILLGALFRWTLGPENFTLITQSAEPVTMDMIDIESANPGGVFLLWALFFVVAFVGTRLSLVTPAAAVEDTGIVGLLRASWRASKGAFWRIFATLILLSLTVAIVDLVASVIVGLAVSLMGGVAPLSIGALLTGLVQGAVLAVFMTLVAMMLTHIYLQGIATPPVRAEPSVPPVGGDETPV